VERISVELEAWMPMQSEVAQASVKSCPLYMAPQMVIVDPEIRKRFVIIYLFIYLLLLLKRSSLSLLFVVGLSIIPLFTVLGFLCSLF